MRARRLTSSCLLATVLRAGPIKGHAGMVPPAWIDPPRLVRTYKGSEVTVTIGGHVIPVESISYEQRAES